MKRYTAVPLSIEAPFKAALSARDATSLIGILNIIGKCNSGQSLIASEDASTLKQFSQYIHDRQATDATYDGFNRLCTSLLAQLAARK